MVLYSPVGVTSIRKEDSRCSWTTTELQSNFVTVFEIALYGQFYSLLHFETNYIPLPSYPNFLVRRQKEL